ncbi:VOC family protein [Paracoccus benzoatiresistens]|uniref:VOC family protein n=1 Tax=Paracoccus benzoatiresistens TaxID=2997341 RepID=UPI00352FF1F8
MLPVRDLARAREFYEQALALPAGEERLDGKVVSHCGGTEIALFPKPEGTKAEHTALSFRVNDIRVAINELEARGVVFPTMIFRDSGRWSMSACWAPKKPRGSAIQKATSSACTRISFVPLPRVC